MKTIKQIYDIVIESLVTDRLLNRNIEQKMQNVKESLLKADDVDVGDLTTFAKIKDNKQTLINGIILKIKDLGKDNVNISFVPIDKNIPSKTIITSWINNTAKPNIIIDIIKKFDGTYKDKNNNVYNIIKAKKVI